MSEESVSSLNQLLKSQPPLLEVTTHARTEKVFLLGTQLQLDKVNLKGCKDDLCRMYDLWIQEKAENATRGNLLDALRAIQKKDVARIYEAHVKTMVPVSDSTEPKVTDPNTTNVPISAPYPETTNFPVPVSTSTEPNTSSVQPLPVNPPHSNYVPQHNPAFPHPNINPTVGGGGYQPNPYHQYYPPQPYQYPYPAPNPPYYQQPYAIPYAPQFNPYAYQTNPNPAFVPQTNPNPAYTPQANPNPAYTPQTNPNPVYVPQTNPNLPQNNPYPAFAPQPNPHAPQLNPNTTNIPTLQLNPNTTNIPTLQANLSTTNVPTPQDNPNTTNVPTSQTNLSTTNIPTLQDNPNTTNIPTPQDNPNTTNIPTPQDNPNTTNIPTPQDNPNTTNIPTPQDNPNTTNIPTPQDNPNTTNVPVSQPNTNATPIVNTIVTDETRADFDTQVKMQHDDKRVGLMVIMGVVNKYGPQGTDIDINRVEKTFQVLNFATWVIKDPTPEKVREAVKIVTEYNFPLSFRGVVVYYAGHGGSYNDKGYFFLPCGDDKHDKFLIDNELIAPFQPKNKECRLANRFRLFLFDCCLKEDKESGEAPTAKTVITTNPLLPTYQPEDDYTVVAHASYLRKPSKGNFSEGGVWTGCLCDNIKKFANDKTISGILEQTRLDVISKTKGAVQAPFHKSIGGDVKLIEGTVPSTDPIIPTPPAAADPGPGTVPSTGPIIPTPPIVPPAANDIDIEKIMNAIPEKSDLMTVLDGIKDDAKKWRELFGKRLLKDVKNSDSWFRNFTELEFLIDEITGDNADDYIYTWGSVINALDKPTIINIGSNRAGFKPVSDVVRDHLNNRDVYDNYMDQLK